MKRFIATFLCLVLVAACLTGCGKAEKKVINVYAFTDEVPGMIDKYIEKNPSFAEKYEIKTTIVATTDGLYQPALDEALKAGGADAPDLYCAEAAFILKYAQGDMASYAAKYEDLGIKAADLQASQIADYSAQIGTRPSDNALVALGYQATGGCFIYRRSIAKAAFGSDDPATVQAAIGGGSGSWDKFWDAAEKVKAAGYKIVSGDGDMWHAIENSSAKGWVVDGKLYIDPARESLLDVSKKLIDNDYHNDTQDWQEGWFADMKKSGTALGFFGPAWLINYTIAPNAGEGDDSSAGDWAVCNSPIGFFWGGTWLLANKDSKVKDGVAEIIKWITIDSSETGLQYYWANGTLNGEGGTKDTVASGTVMSKSNGELSFLGGQNMFDYFVPANKYANGKNLTQYDESINTYWRDAVRAYAHGTMTRDEAIASFKANVKANLNVVVE